MLTKSTQPGSGMFQGSVRLAALAYDPGVGVGHSLREMVEGEAARHSWLFICAREFVFRNTRGQTMTEYALILAAIAVVVYGVYAAVGNSIGSLASGVDSALTSA
jgi:Flp pilus assembly pilin Flp